MKIDVETKRQALDQLPDLLSWPVVIGGGATGKIQEREFEMGSELKKNGAINWSRNLSTLFLKKLKRAENKLAILKPKHY